jgi:hypothetical protein
MRPALIGCDRRAQTAGVGKKRNRMRREMQITLDTDANHRALRRCHGCGSYARPFADDHGVIRCERCARKVRRDEEEDLNRPANLIV